MSFPPRYHQFHHLTCASASQTGLTLCDHVTPLSASRAALLVSGNSRPDITRNFQPNHHKIVVPTHHPVSDDEKQFANMASSLPQSQADQTATPSASQQPSQQQLPNGTQPAATADSATATATGAPTPPIPESKLPTRKDASLKEFLNKMDDYAPIVRFLSLPLTFRLLWQ